MLIVLPKGRSLNLSLRFLRLIGVSADYDPKSRSLTFETTVKTIKVVTLKMTDILQAIHHGGADFGVAGSDVINERWTRTLTHTRIGSAMCYLAVASFIHKPNQHLKIATKYPKTTTRFTGPEVPTTLVKLSGALEASPSISLAGTIVDIVGTGTTLEANGLERLKQIDPVFLCGAFGRKVKERKHPSVNLLTNLLNYSALYLC